MDPLLDERYEIVDDTVLNKTRTSETITLPRVGLYTCPMCQGRGVCTKSVVAARGESHRFASDDRFSDTAGTGSLDQNGSSFWLPEVAEFTSYEGVQEIQPSPQVNYKPEPWNSTAFPPSMPQTFSLTNQNLDSTTHSGGSSMKKLPHKKPIAEHIADIWPGIFAHDDWPSDTAKRPPTFTVSLREIPKEHPKAIYKRSSNSNTISQTSNAHATLGRLSHAASASKNKTSISHRSTDAPSLLLEKRRQQLQPHDTLRIALIGLHSTHWEEVVHGLQGIVQISRWQPALIEPNMAAVYRVIVSLLRGTRSHVTRIACQAARELFRTMQSTNRPEFDELVGALLGRTADLNRFIRQDANEALDSMVTYLPPQACVRALIARGCSHRHPLVRSSTARLLTCCSVVVGPGGLLAQCTKKDARTNLLCGAASLLADPNQQTRSFAKKLFESLVEHEEFDTIFKSCVDENLANKVKKAVTLIKYNLTLPILLRNNGSLLKQFLCGEDLAMVLAGCNKYPVPETTLPTEKLSTTMAKIRPDDSLIKFPEPAERWQQALGDLWKISSSGMKCRHDPNLARSLYILETNDGVMKAVEENLILLVQPSAKTLLDHLERLRDCVTDRLKVGPAEALQREKDLRTAWVQGNEAVGKFGELQRQLEEQRQQLGAVVDAKAREVARLRADINATRQQCQDDVKRIVNNSERAMVLDSRNSEYRWKHLNSQLKTEKEHLEKLLAEHLRGEHELRTKKHKMETLLITWLQKFDTEIGDKQTEFEQLSDEYEAEQAEMNELQEKLNETEEEYQSLLAEKEEYEREEEEELVYMLRSRWAARVIQRAWQEYRIRKKAKKGKGKGKKGKGKREGKGKPKESKEGEPKEPKTKPKGKGKKK